MMEGERIKEKDKNKLNLKYMMGVQKLYKDYLSFDYK